MWSTTCASAPCLAVDRRRGFAVVPDLETRTQVLLVPTRRIVGIESPALLAPDSPNYWAYAWEARRYVERRARRSIPRDMLALAVNSALGRNQDQLHIHVDCVSPPVREALIAHQSIITGAWTAFPFDLRDSHYQVMRLDGEDLGSRDPFKLLANGDPAARLAMGERTLVVVGTNLGGSPGFVVIAGRAGVPDNLQGAGEALLDHTCAVLHGS
jgi:CDP-diacylglycerol pyrophosphatase